MYTSRCTNNISIRSANQKKHLNTSYRLLDARKLAESRVASNCWVCRYLSFGNFP